MPVDNPEHAIYLEIGKRKVFACALHWPGWCRSGRDEASALEALYQAGPRYGRVAAAAGLAWEMPQSPAAFTVVERVEGNATTDFGAPARIVAADYEAIDAAALQRLGQILKACWGAFDGAVAAAQGKALRKGPRGGGRDVASIVEHVAGADLSYLGRIGRKVEGGGAEAGSGDAAERLARMRAAILAGLDEGAAGLLPEEGPRGGRRWPPRYFVRRVAWHVLDHAWEIEDRVEG